MGANKRYMRALFFMRVAPCMPACSLAPLFWPLGRLRRVRGALLAALGELGRMVAPRAVRVAIPLARPRVEEQLNSTQLNSTTVLS